MACSSPKHVLVMLLAVFLTVGFSFSAAQASVMSAKMTMMTGSGMTMPADVGMATGSAMNGDCKACLKGTSDSGNPIHCPPVCVAPVLAVLPQDLAIRMVLRAQQPSALPARFLRGRSSVPDPFPPRPIDLV
ncbi:MAG: hypothetical protein J0I79_11155 [Mesorhizobium sp.]|nr:hypothetical protein [Mesorhizobium sp.]